MLKVEQPIPSYGRQSFPINKETTSRISICDYLLFRHSIAKMLKITVKKVKMKGWDRTGAGEE